MPRNVPITVEMAAATRPTAMETRPAYTILAYMSRPASSVPRILLQVGAIFSLSRSA